MKAMQLVLSREIVVVKLPLHSLTPVGQFSMSVNVVNACKVQETYRCAPFDMSDAAELHGGLTDIEVLVYFFGFPDKRLAGVLRLDLFDLQGHSIARLNACGVAG